MPYWAVIRSVPNHERLAAEGVALAGFETFIPRVRVKNGARWRTTPLFGCYFFVRVVDRWRILERTIGVLHVIKFGGAPAKCPDAEIAALLERSDPDGIVRLPPRLPSRPSSAPLGLAPGTAVAITDGPFRGLSGVYAGMSARERELVLLNVLGAQRPVEVAAGLLAPH
jgi:transcriptional antiterminator RfaH